MSNESAQIEIEWFITRDTLGTGLAAWKRTFGIDSTGTVFLPVGVFFSEDDAFFSASHDGTSIAMWKGHLYVPSETIAEQCPDIADDIRRAVVNMKASVNSPLE